MSKLTHLDEHGRAQMVDVTDKEVTERVAVAKSVVNMQAKTLKLIIEGGHKKGDVIAVARIAGIQAAKKCSELIPMCHPLMLTSVKVDIEIDEPNHRLVIFATCKLSGKTGVEMEALTAASIAALTVYDMCKAVDRGMIITDTQLVKKSGGKSSEWNALDEKLAD